MGSVRGWRVAAFDQARVGSYAKCPRQRGTNEYTNGFSRQYFPKGTDLSVRSQHDLDQAAYSLNTRHRQALEWMTPSDKLAEARLAWSTDSRFLVYVEVPIPADPGTFLLVMHDTATNTTTKIPISEDVHDIRFR